MNVVAVSGAAAAATWLVCGLIAILLIYGLTQSYSQFSSQTPSNELVRALPAIVVSLGIFGTFLGIYLGLRDFDTSRIDQSIPALLEGLKTAFLTSLAGMFAGLVLRVEYAWLDGRRPKESAEDPIELLRSIAGGIQGAEKTITAVGEMLVRCFRADDDYSLVSQLKLIRTDMNDLKREVTVALNAFAEKVSELGTEALVKSLQIVIEQFNARLSDLVGAEFKQLRDAMIKLVEWQQHHRDAVDAMQARLAGYLDSVKEATNLLERSAASMGVASEHLDSIDSSMSALSVSAEDIAAHMEALKAQNQALATLMVEVKRLGEEASKVVPSLTTHLNEVSGELLKAGMTLKERSDETILLMKDSVETVGQSLNTIVKRHDDHVVKTIQELESGLDKTLNQSLASLGGQLAALSAKFTQDYTPLTDRLREVVRIGERLNDVPQG